MWQLPCGAIITEQQLEQAFAFYMQRCKTIQEVIDEVDAFFKP